MLKALLDRALKRLITDNRYGTLTETQIEAYIDLLAIAMVIDHHIAQSERDLISAIIEQFDWPSQRPSEHVVNASVRRAWILIESETLQADTLTACFDIARRLRDEWIMESAFISLLQVIQSDDRLDMSELNLLDHAAEAFGFGPQRVEQLKERAARQRVKVESSDLSD